MYFINMQRYFWHYTSWGYWIYLENDEEVKANPKYEFLQRFDYVLCNKLKKKDTNKSAIINGYDVP